MRNRCTAGLSGLVLALAAGCAAAPFPPGADAGSDAARDTAEVLAAAESFLTAFNHLEWEPFYASFSPSATVFQPFGDPWRNEGRDEVAAFFRVFFDRIRAAAEGPPHLGIDPEADQRGAITLVFERREGEWLVVRAHESLTRDP